MRRALKIILGIAVAGLLALATLPWWFGAVAAPLVKRWGISFEGYAAHGYSHFTIREARFARGNTAVTVHDIEAAMPLRWLHPTGRRGKAANWNVEVRASIDPTPTPGRVGGMPSLHELLMKIAEHLDRWLHDFEVGAGEVRWPAGGLSLAGAHWRNHTLATRSLRFLRQEGDVTVTVVPSENLLRGEARFLAGEAAVNLAWKADTVTGTVTLWTQPLALSARFPERGWLPAEALARAENWTVPAGKLKLGAPYATISGSGGIAWREDAYALSINARADPHENAKAPALTARVDATGNPEVMTLSALELDAPFAKARLSAPLIIGFDGQPRGEAAQLSVDADLSKLPDMKLRGTLRGTASLARTDAPLEFQADLRDVDVGGFTLSAATARGRWLWPRLEILQLDARLDETNRLQAAGAIDWSVREFQAVKISGTLNSTALKDRLPNLRWERLAGVLTLDGPLAGPRHTGELQVTQVETAVVKPFSATAIWRATGNAWDDVSVKAQAGTTRMSLRGSGEPHNFTLSEFTLAPINAEALTLAQPAAVAWLPAPRLEGLRLKNSTASFAADVVTGAQPHLSLLADHFDKEWIGQWLDIPGPTWVIERLQARAHTEGEAVHFDVQAAGEVRAPQKTARIALVATGNQDGIAIRELKLSEGGRVLTQLTGQLPVVWRAGAALGWQVRENVPFALAAEIVPESPLWPMVAEPAGLELAQASAQANLRGTLREPEGELRASLRSVKVIRPGRFKNLPQIEGFQLKASATRSQVQIDSLTARIEGQALQASARWAMNEERWRTLFAGPAEFDWSDAEGLVEIPDADLAPLARRLPEFFAAQGRLTARVQLAPGGGLSGTLALKDAASRPLPSLGTLQEINAAVTFEGRELRIDRAGAKLGGEPLTITGSARFPLRQAPAYSLRLQGKNLPVVRRAGLLLRSDVDLRAETVAGGTTRVSGQILLRDGLLLSDLSALFPTGTREVSRRPPYFAVESAPFNRWPVEITVRGRNALRVRTPVFTGMASAHFDLSGTLGEPRAVGELTVDEGMLFFPFATFTIQNGAVRLAASDPFSPQITVNAISRRRNYELRLEMRGSPETPSLTFSSNPPLEASEVLLMVMAGQMPANETAGVTASGGVRFGQVGAYLGQSLYRSLGGTGENRLEIVSGEQISRQGRETYEIAYKLGDKWTLVGEYDEFDNYNAGLKWRIYTQEGDHE